MCTAEDLIEQLQKVHKDTVIVAYNPAVNNFSPITCMVMVKGIMVLETVPIDEVVAGMKEAGMAVTRTTPEEAIALVEELEPEAAVNTSKMH